MKAYVLMLAASVFLGARAFAQTIPPMENYQPTVLIEAKFGEGLGEYLQPDETAPRPIMAIDDHENIYVLDEFSNRVQHYDANGRLIGQIQIQSYAPATKELAQKAPMIERSISIDGMRFVGVTLYALQVNLSKKTVHDVLKMQGNQFVHVKDAKEREQILSELKYAPGKNEAKIATLLAKDPKFKVTRTYSKSRELTEYSNPTYDGLPIGYVTIDKDKNKWIFFNSWIIRKYNPSGGILFELDANRLGQVLVSRQGNIFALNFFSMPPSEDEAGIRITRYSKK